MDKLCFTYIKKNYSKTLFFLSLRWNLIIAAPVDKKNFDFQNCVYTFLRK